MLRVLFLFNQAYTVRAGYVDSSNAVNERNGWERIYGVLKKEKVDMGNFAFGSGGFLEHILESYDHGTYIYA